MQQLIGASASCFDTRPHIAVFTNPRAGHLGCALCKTDATLWIEGIEANLGIAFEHSISFGPLMDAFEQFSLEFSHVTLEILRPDPGDIAPLLKEGRADLGLMTEQESYPTEFQFRGVGHSRMVPVCAWNHPLSKLKQIGFHDLRQHRQLIPHSRSMDGASRSAEPKSTSLWYAESPYVLVELILLGIGWVELPFSVVTSHIGNEALAQLDYSFQQSDILEGIDVVWTEQKGLGAAAHWLKGRLVELPQDVWRG